MVTSKSGGSVLQSIRLGCRGKAGSAGCDDPVVELHRHEGLNQNVYYNWWENFLEAAHDAGTEFNCEKIDSPPMYWRRHELAGSFYAQALMH
jgi:hypothetical protein